jgi:hypothetical protein
MPVSYRFDSTIVIIELSGEYSINDIRQTFLNSLADPQKPTNASLLIHIAGSESILKRTVNEVQSMADFVASLAGRFNNHIALVAPNDLPYGLMRMTSVDAEEKGIKTAVFRSCEKAREWLLT